MSAQQLFTAHSPHRRPGTWRVAEPSAKFTRPPTDIGYLPSRRHMSAASSPPATIPRARPTSYYSPSRTYSSPQSSHASWRRRSTATNGWTPDRSVRHSWTAHQPYWDDSPTVAHLPLEDVADTPGLVHAWEKHHVLSWLHAVGLGDVVAKVKAKGLSGEDLLLLTPKNISEELDLQDQTVVMRVLSQLMPLKEAWKAARQAAGLKIKLKEVEKPPPRTKRLVAELHVLIDGLSALPPGATGAYVLLEMGDHVAKSTYVPNSQQQERWYVEDSHHAMLAWGQPHHSGAGFVQSPADDGYVLHPAEETGGGMGGWPQTFKLTIDEKLADKKDDIIVEVIAWFPQVRPRPHRACHRRPSAALPQRARPCPH